MSFESFFVVSLVGVVSGAALPIFGPIVWRSVTATYRRTPVVPLEADPRFLAARYKADHFDVLLQYVDETAEKMITNREEFLERKDPMISTKEYDAYLQALKDVAMFAAALSTKPVGPSLRDLRDTLHP